jgi:hypothetical protein
MVISARRCPGQEDTDASLALSFVLAVDATYASWGLQWRGLLWPVSLP